MREVPGQVRTIFMGSPDYAATILSALYDSGHSIIGVITQPDKRVGRGKHMQSPPVKLLADDLGLPCYQPSSVKNKAFQETLAEINPELIIVAAYGKILRKHILEFPKYGCVNVHASLLPRWRGASPVHAAILHGDEQTGVTIMKMDEGIDTGGIIASHAVSLVGTETTGQLTEQLAHLGADLLVKTLPDYVTGHIEPVAQNEEQATYAGLIEKQDGLIDFILSAEEIERKVRAMDPWPTAFFTWDNRNIKVFSAEILPANTLSPGKRGTFDKYPIIGTATNDLMLRELQMPGKNRVDGKTFLNGARGW